MRNGIASDNSSKSDAVAQIKSQIISQAHTLGINIPLESITICGSNKPDCSGADEGLGNSSADEFTVMSVNYGAPRLPFIGKMGFKSQVVMKSEA